jgi:outer membrane protein TolC
MFRSFFTPAVVAAVATVAACLLRVPDVAAQQASTPQSLTLTAAIEMAQRQGARARAARHTLDAARASYSALESRAMPQVFLSGDVPSYNRSIIPVQQPDGSVEFRPQQQTNSSLNLIVTQAIPLTGGSLSVFSQLAQLKRTGAPETWSSTPFSVQLSQPILRSNTMKWDRAEQALSADLAERVYDESLEDVAGATAVAFITAYSAREILRDATESLQRNERLREKVATRYRLGGVSASDVRQVELGYLRAQQAVSQATLQRDEADATLRAVLGLPSDAAVDVVLPNEPPDISPDTTEAIAAALRSRSDLVMHELQDTRGRRAESQARFDNGIGATVNATYGYNATGLGVGDVYDELLDRQAFRLTVQFPIWQWGAAGADRDAARAARAASTANAQDQRDQIRRDVAFTVRRLSQARRSLAIAIQADSLSNDRAQDALIRYDFGSVTIETVFLALNDRDQAAQQRILSLASYWTEFYRLRRVTMFDFAEGRAIR